MTPILRASRVPAGGCFAARAQSKRSVQSASLSPQPSEHLIETTLRLQAKAEGTDHRLAAREMQARTRPLYCRSLMTFYNLKENSPCEVQTEERIDNCLLLLLMQALSKEVHLEYNSV